MGYFGWLLFATLNPRLPSSKTPLIFYSNQLHDDLKLIVLRSIRSAKRSIHLQIYGLTDSDVICALKKAIHRGVKIYLFYDPTASHHLDFGYPVKIPGGLMHRKICVIDEMLTLIGTANFTTTSLKMHQNMIVGLYHQGAAKHFARSTEQWGHFQIKGTSIKSCFLPDFNQKALEKLVQWIDSSQETIQIALFTLTHPRLIKALIRASRRGVEIKVALDRYTIKGASCRAATALAKAGIAVLSHRGDGLLHHKWMFIDHQRLVVGSANWTKAAFKHNQDVLLFFDSLKNFDRVRMKKLWEAIAIATQKQ